MRPYAVLACVLGIAGCSTTPPPAQQADDTPARPTAVIETHVSSNGLKGLFPFESTERRLVRADMSRDEHTIKGTGTFSGFLVNSFGSGDDATISRLDRNRRWTLDLRKKQYTECPVHGCAVASGKQPSREQKPAQQQPEAKRDPGCVMHVAKKHFTVTPTGKKRDINGFDTDEYQVAWIVTLRDPSRRQSVSSLKVDVWTTPVTPAMREAMRVEEAYARAYGGKIAAAARGEVIPPEVSQMMTGYLRGLTPSDRAALVGVGHELAKIKGHPILTRIDWDFSGDACGAADSGSGGSGGSAGSDSPAAAFAGIAGMFKKGGDKGKAGESEPLLSFTVEVKSLKVEPVRDGLFSVPRGFQLVNRP